MAGTVLKGWALSRTGLASAQKRTQSATPPRARNSGARRELIWRVNGNENDKILPLRLLRQQSCLNVAI